MSLFDADLESMSVGELRDQVMRTRTYLRWLLRQQDDDLCWRDFYVLATALLPEAPDLTSLNTLPSKPLMLHNCERFVDSLAAYGHYVPDDKDRAIERLTLRVRELGG